MITLSTRPAILRTTHKKRQRTIVNNANRHKVPDKRIRMAEVIAGRSSMYGVVFGGANWALTGLDVFEQAQHIPFALLGIASGVLVTTSFLNADKKLTKRQFEDYVTRNTGRVFMLIFGWMSLVSVIN
jgi:hypothetical protein